ncbi:MAG: serine/threonine-protein phosphatase [Polaromonas sp.]|nr:serine/threonine-protein phosphatase [Polaromonas sp.]
MKFSVFQLSRIGGRAMNEDRMGYCYTRESGLFVLADGMGGHPQGEVAAQIALDTICACYQQAAQPVLADPAEFLANAMLAAHRQIVRYASEKGMLDTPRTTLVAAVVQDARATWLHCGDSRLYLVRDGQLLLRTRDHSFLEQDRPGAAQGELLNRNILFTCLGSPIRPTFDTAGPFALQQGDKLMLCSDGLWGSLDEAEIVRQLSAEGVCESVPALVERALLAGGRHCDNVTVLALEWQTPEVFATTRSLAAGSAADGAFASTLQGDLLGSQADDLDDAMIERSIAEINAAIRRSAAKKA